MTITLDDLLARKKAYQGQVGKHYDVIEREKAELNAVSALLLQIEMLEMAEKDPTIEAFSFDAHYEYDDEGSYYWSASFQAKGQKHDAGVDRWEECEHLEQIAGEDGTALAFGGRSSFEGTVTVAQIREELLK